MLNLTSMPQQKRGGNQNGSYSNRRRYKKKDKRGANGKNM